MDSHLAYFILNLIPGIGPITIKKLLRHFSKPEDLLELDAREMTASSGVPFSQTKKIANWKESTTYEEELQMCERSQVEIITPADEMYPEMLKEIYDPPLTLYVRGNSSLLKKPNLLAVVGSRRISHYGREICEQIVRSAALAKWITVSGLARGIDAVAHSTSLKCDTPTLAVLGCGVGRIYPQDHLQLAAEIADNGAVISEFPLLYPPDRRTFPMRNRIISGMCRGTLVVEAGLKSGSLITAEQALEQGRQVFAVPGPATSPQSKGCHRLIKCGAKLTESFDDIAEEFLSQPELFTNFSSAPEKEDNHIEINLNELEKTLVSIMERERVPLSADYLADASEITVSEVLRCLMVLEIKRIVRQLPGMRFAVEHGQIS